MKYLKLFEEYNNNFDEIIKILERDCYNFLYETDTPLLRGVKNVTPTEVEDLYYKHSYKGDRNPKDTPINQSEMIDNLFEKYFDIRLRSNGVFASKSRIIASDYGKCYMFFPIDSYEYYWNHKVDDLYSKIELFGPPEIYDGKGRWFYDDEQLDFEYSYQDDEAYQYAKNKYPDFNPTFLEFEKMSQEEILEKYNEALSNYLEKYIRDYITTNINSANAQEITFVCDKYYLVDMKYYQEMIEYLSKNK